MSVQKVKKGSFDFKPNKLIPYFSFEEIGWWTIFDASCNYDYGDANQQKDWLKVGGVAFALFPWQKHENSAMLGFRYNPATNRIELLDYWHIDGVTDRGIGREPIASVALGEKFVWWIKGDAKTKVVSLHVRTSEGTIVKTQQFSKLSTLFCWPIGGYAGGDVKAVQDMFFNEYVVNVWGENGPVDESKKY